MAGSLMVIFSLGGAQLVRRMRSRSVRCRTGFLPLEGPPEVMISPWPAAEEGTRGVVAGGEVRMLAAGGSEVASGPLAALAAAGGARAGDLQLLGFVAAQLWTWVGLPLALSAPGVEVADRGGGVVDVTVPEGWPVERRSHRLHLDGEGRVVRHQDGPFVHHLSGHCDFGGVTVATRRRTTAADRVTVLWGDVVAAAVHPGVAR
ncbi:MAG TPA: hypothetical protein VM390_05750 [Acidimicrobiales bacterium]|jgi:hypothetical protein|nr:hypothetical protein [Acidimicrobiales bacterium]